MVRKALLGATKRGFFMPQSHDKRDKIPYTWRRFAIPMGIKTQVNLAP
jgi:hypothetical protein